jgi:WhiB family redox-sensing transcriptional regulator
MKRYQWQWRVEAACRDMNPNLFYSEQVALTTVKAICHRCPVQYECLQHALKHDEVNGIWGGYSERERRSMRPDHVIQSTKTRKVS